MHDRFLSVLLLVAAAACGVRTDLPDADAEGGGDGGGVRATSASSSSTSSVGSSGAGGDMGPPPEPTMLFVEADFACAVAAPPRDAAIALSPLAPGDVTGVVELLFADECTGAGGQHIIMRTLDQSRELWLGSHACYYFDPSLVGGPFGYGVVRYTPTAALFQIDPNVCIGWPGEPPGLTSDSQVRAVGVFASLADAQAFASTLD